MGQTAPVGTSAWGKPPAGDQANAVISGAFTAVGPGPAFAFRGPVDFAFYASYNTALTVTKGLASASVASAGTIAAGTAINSVLVPPGTTVGAISGTSVTLAFPKQTWQASPQGVGSNILTNMVNTSGLLGASVSGPGIPSGTIVLAIVPASAGQANGSVQLSNAVTSYNDGPLGIQPQFDFAVNGNAITASGTDAAAIFTGSTIVYSGSVQLERSWDGANTWVVCNVGGAGTMAIYGAGTPVSSTFGEPEKQVYYRPNCTAYVSGPINYRLSTTGAAAESLSIAAAI